MDCSMDYNTDYRAENFKRAIRNNAVEHIKARKHKSYQPTEEEIESEVKIIQAKIIKL